MSAAALASIGDHGVLNRIVAQPLSDVWLDRDLSWLDFNERVLAEALDERTPLLERVKFLAIFTSNLDEFFMKRMAVLRNGEVEERRELIAAPARQTAPSAARSGGRATTRRLFPDWETRHRSCGVGTT